MKKVKTLTWSLAMLLFVFYFTFIPWIYYEICWSKNEAKAASESKTEQVENEFIKEEIRFLKEEIKFLKEQSIQKENEVNNATQALVDANNDTANETTESLEK